ncbi:hypothetical protein NESM_000809800 [Novymonas esmeraldas]|uniref:Uncharacterized protein n=1 Tax=Novymonas esmeraldas TaxID=1808958 RepID=A0AAW0EWW0_9TRYP
MVALSASNGVVGSLGAAHPISCVATLPSGGTDAVIVVCAGGSCVSVQVAPPQWLAAGASECGGSLHGGGLGGVAASSGLRAAEACEAVQDAGAGASAVMAAARRWCMAHAREEVRAGAAAAGGMAHTPLAPEQRISLSAGAVTCLCVSALPGSSDTAVAVVGTTVGSVALLLIEGGRAVYTVAECALAEWSGGAITAQDAVVDVAVGMDPAGRPEFISAASAGCVVVVDVQLLYSAPQQRRDGGGGEGRQSRGGVPDAAVSAGDTAWSSSALRAKAVEALERPGAHASPVRRSGSEVFFACFTGADVVRLLAPQRLQAALAMDVAVVVVLSSGALHYVERIVDGGSVHLLAQHHERRLARGGTPSVLAAVSDASDAALGGGGAAASRLLTDSRAVPHVVYRYRLSAYHVDVCQTDRGLTSHGADVSGGAEVAAVTHVCDACLYMAEHDAVCHVVLVGTQRVPLGRAAAVTHLPSSTSLATGSTLGDVQSQHHRGMMGGGYRTVGWWAIAQNCVLPRHTFDRAALERAASRQLLRHQSAGVDRDGASLYSASDAGSPYMVHVQSSTMALGGGHGAAPASLSASVLTSPAASSPAGAAASAGGGFAAAAMLAGALVVASGQDLYFGDLRDIHAGAKTLPALQLLRSFTGVVEGLAAAPPHAGGQAVLVATGAHVAPVALV